MVLGKRKKANWVKQKNGTENKRGRRAKVNVNCHLAGTSSQDEVAVKNFVDGEVIMVDHSTAQQVG